MYISKTPLRISLFSGGDMAAFYKHHVGVCLSCTIDKYVYVSVNHNANGQYRTMYEDIEDYDNLDDIKNSIIKETLSLYGYGKYDGVTISSIMDIPSHGSGLGSSSAFTVGLINSLVANENHDGYPGPEWLASEACQIEIKKCKHPIGKQDQYAAAYGGMNMFKFYPDESVEVIWNSAWERNIERLRNKLLLIYSGIKRNANDILKEQEDNLKDFDKFQEFAALKKNGEYAIKASNAIISGDLNPVGEMLDDAWKNKKKLASGISNPAIDEMYDIAMKNGATGGKLIGAGGGGYFLFFVPREYDQDQVARAIGQVKPESRKLNFNFSHEGSKVFKI